jgi:hypothetical protein
MSRVDQEVKTLHGNVSASQSLVRDLLVRLAHCDARLRLDISRFCLLEGPI